MMVDEVTHPMRLPKAVLGGGLSSLGVHIVVELIGSFGGHVSITEERIAERVGRPLWRVRRELRRLEAAGVIRRTGTGRSMFPIFTVVATTDWFNKDNDVQAEVSR